MLTKDECLKALDKLRTNGKMASLAISGCRVFEQLINEHFELVEKYTPKKVINRHYEGYVREADDAYDIYEGICPNCGKQIDSYESEVLCVYCEQRLDWED